VTVQTDPPLSATVQRYSDAIVYSFQYKSTQCTHCRLLSFVYLRSTCCGIEHIFYIALHQFIVKLFDSRANSIVYNIITLITDILDSAVTI